MYKDKQCCFHRDFKNSDLQLKVRAHYSIFCPIFFISMSVNTQVECRKSNRRVVSKEVVVHFPSDSLMRIISLKNGKINCKSCQNRMGRRTVYSLGHMTSLSRRGRLVRTTDGKSHLVTAPLLMLLPCR